LAAELKKQMGVESKLIAGGGGVFEVSADGKVIFSKKSVGRFPEVQEIIGALQKTT
jgi:selT/selW/selH-like putative selenoprotein